jgi:ACS family hexuronate transporter-like MFS transporter
VNSSSSSRRAVEAILAEHPKRSSHLTHFRWVICGLLLFGTTKNYMDRQVIGILKIPLQHQFGWSEIDYGNLVSAFQGAYALGMLAIGWLIDRIGTRIGYALAMTTWSLASMAHGMAGSLGGFLGARFALGFGEAGVFPASLKAVSEWFPKKERALATGIFNAGTNLGAIVAPLLVPWISDRWGWRWAFFLIGALGFVWLAFWLAMYRRPEQHPSCSASELEYIRGDGDHARHKIGWLKILRHRQAWAFASGKFIIDPIWWFYLFWIPDFLHRQFGLAVKQTSWPIIAIYVMADFGSVLAGGMSSALIHRGSTVNSARKWAMLVCAVGAVPVIFVPRTAMLWGAVLLIGLAAAAHQGFSANLLTLSSDMFPRKAVASVVGIGGMAGAVGGMFIAKIVAHFLQWTGSYQVPFFMAGSAYLIALAVVHVLAPKLEPAQFVDAQT